MLAPLLAATRTQIEAALATEPARYALLAPELRKLCATLRWLDAELTWLEAAAGRQIVPEEGGTDVE